MSKPLVLTSPNNAKSVGLDLALVISGISYANHPELAPALMAWLGGDLVVAWGCVLSVVALASAVAAITASIAYCKYRVALKVEATAAGLVALLMGIYGWAILFHSTRPASPVLLGVFAAAFLCRVGQVVYDLIRDWRSRRQGKTLTREVLADSKG